MDKKRSMGVTLLSIYLMFSGVLGLMDFGPNMNARIIVMIFGIVSILAGVLLFRLNAWGRIISIILFYAIAGFNIINNVPNLNDYGANQSNIVFGYIAPHLIVYGAFIFFLNKPKIKEQFNRNL